MCFKIENLFIALGVADVIIKPLVNKENAEDRTFVMWHTPVQTQGAQLV